MVLFPLQRFSIKILIEVDKMMKTVDGYVGDGLVRECAFRHEQVVKDNPNFPKYL